MRKPTIFSTAVIVFCSVCSIVPTWADQPDVQQLDGAARNGGAMLAPAMHDLSPWRMFLGADIVVQGVMLGLVFASLVTWTIFLAKSIELGLAKRRLSTSLTGLRQSESIAEAMRAANDRSPPLAAFLAAAAGEMAYATRGASPDGIKERTASAFSEITKRAASTARSGMGILATIGATAPFVGLFGTVWGIMNSFIGISKAHTTNLAVVAPGIAEALLATAIGLIAAIPAVILYNHFSRMLRSYSELLQLASGFTLRLVSRELDLPGEATLLKRRA